MSLMAELGEGPVPEPPVPARLPPPPVEQNRPVITERERPPPRHSTAPLPPPPMQVCRHKLSTPKITRAHFYLKMSRFSQTSFCLASFSKVRCCVVYTSPMSVS